MSQYSAALNESSYLSGNPDPRTGLFSKTLSLGKISGNYRTGPHFSVQLNFTPQNSTSPLSSGEFGAGWSLSLPAYQCDPNALPVSKGHLQLLSGSAYYVEPSDGPISLEGYLLQDMTVTCTLSPLTFAVSHKSGAREIYETILGDTSGNAYLCQIIRKSGHSLHLNYLTLGSAVQLQSITDDTNTTLLSITGDTTLPSITLYPGSAEETVFNLEIAGEELTTFYGPEGYQANFTYVTQYDQLLLATVIDNMGLQETATYSNAMTQPGGQQTQATIQYYFRQNDPNNSDSDYCATYLFDPSNNNYLGYPVIYTTNPLVDSLLHYKDAFSYTTTYTENIGGGSTDVKTTVCTYNKFHSITEKIVTYGDEGYSVSENYQYEVNDQDDVDGQVPTYKRPLSLTQTWSDNNPSNPKTYSKETQLAWDDSGNITQFTASTGIVTQFEYYAANGEDGCPADPDGFIAYRKRKTVTPASVDDSSLPIAPVRETVYTYDQLPVYVNDSQDEAGYFIVRSQKSEQEAQSTGGYLTLSTERYNYYNDADDLLTHGCLSTLARDVITQEEGSTVTRTTQRDFTYSLPTPQAGEATLRRIVAKMTGYDGTAKEETFDMTVLAGRLMHMADTTQSPVALTVDFTYDGLGRLTKAVSCKGSPYEACQAHSYAFTSEDAPYSCKVTTNASGAISKTYYDGSKNVLYEEQQDADGVVSSDTTKYYETTRTVRNALGQTLQETQKDYHASWGAPLTSTTTYEYDAWGNQSVATYTDGHQEIAQQDPLTQSTYKALKIDGATEQASTIVNDLFGNPLSTTRWNTDNSIYSTETSVYDGLGRAVKSTDALSQTTLTIYDAFDRPSVIKQADNTQIFIAYANHSTDQLTTTLTASASDDNGADQYTFGSRSFDGMSRVTQLVIGDRTTICQYTSGANVPNPTSVTLPVGTTLTYTYQPELSYSVLDISSSDNAEPTLTYDYVPTTAHQRSATLAASSSGDKSSWSYTYELSGRTKAQTLNYIVDGESATRACTYSYSLGGLLIEYTDVQGQMHSQTYNTAGQMDTSSLDGTVSSQYKYDGTGRPTSVLATDPAGYTQSTTLTYDEQGREATRTLTVKSSTAQLGTQQQTLAYNAADQTIRRTWQRDGVALRTENYTYTSLGQLTNYTCDGPDYPDSPDGYKLTGQDFMFDFVGNIISVKSYLLDPQGLAITNTATYQYANPDKTQLSGISNDEVTAWDVSLLYDKNGNLTLDEQGRYLTYNSLNQLVAVSDASKTSLGNYWYDANGTLLAEKATADPSATTLYYQAGQLVNELQGTIASTYLNAESRVLTDGQTKRVQLLGSDQQGSIVQIGDSEDVSYRKYDPYGYSE